MTQTLHTTSIPGGPQRVVFLHGLMGQGRNFGTAAKAVKDLASSLLVDLPNHGASPRTEEFDYVDMARSTAAAVREHWPEGPVTVVGHSMGGKVAMGLALLEPELVERLVVVDISPVSTDSHSEFEHLLDSLLGLDLEALESRSEAHEALAEAIPWDTTRAFLLQNLDRTDDGWAWKANLAMLREQLPQVMGFPAEVEELSYAGPVLWVAGGRSDYVQEEFRPVMERYFPATRLVTVKDAAHWVHSQQPEVFHSILRRFLEASTED